MCSCPRHYAVLSGSLSHKQLHGMTTPRLKRLRHVAHLLHDMSATSRSIANAHHAMASGASSKASMGGALQGLLHEYSDSLVQYSAAVKQLQPWEQLSGISDEDIDNHDEYHQHMLMTMQILYGMDTTQLDTQRIHPQPSQAGYVSSLPSSVDGDVALMSQQSNATGQTATNILPVDNAANVARATQAAAAVQRLGDTLGIVAQPHNRQAMRSASPGAGLGPAKGSFQHNMPEFPAGMPPLFTPYMPIMSSSGAPSGPTPQPQYLSTVAGQQRDSGMIPAAVFTSAAPPALPLQPLPQHGGQEHLAAGAPTAAQVVTGVKRKASKSPAPV